MRDRLLGSGVLGSDDLAVSQLVFDELLHELVVEGFRKVFRFVGVGDLHALMEVVARGEISLGELVQTRVLEMPNRPCLAYQLAFESDDTRFLADDLAVLADLAFGRGALFFCDIGRKRELRDFTTHVAR